MWTVLEDRHWLLSYSPELSILNSSQLVHSFDWSTHLQIVHRKSKGEGELWLYL